MNNFKEFIKTIVPITDSEFTDSIKYFKKVNLKKGDYFIQQGKICKQIAFINKGTLRTYYFNHKAEEITSCFCTENSFSTSYKSFILQEPSNLSIQAIEEVELLVIDYNVLQRLYETSISWQNIGRIIAEKEFIVMEKYAAVLNNETAKEKYLRLMEEQPIVLEKAKIKHIASFLGVTSRTLSRIRQEVAEGI